MAPPGGPRAKEASAAEVGDEPDVTKEEAEEAAALMQEGIHALPSDEETGDWIVVGSVRIE